MPIILCCSSVGDSAEVPSESGQGRDQYDGGLPLELRGHKSVSHAGRIPRIQGLTKQHHLSYYAALVRKHKAKRLNIMQLVHNSAWTWQLDRFDMPSFWSLLI